jgi:DnaJ-class molecular chaperone
MPEQRSQQQTGTSDDWRKAAGILSGEDNYYQLLDVPMTANRREITRAYRLTMMKWHPDRVRPEQREHAEDLSRRVNNAFSTLSDPIRRKHYDQTIRNDALQAEIMGRYVGGFFTGAPSTMAAAPRRTMTARERAEQRQSSRQANIGILMYFGLIAITGIALLLLFSLVNFASSAFF